jgi:HlyD family secretion protein
MYKILPLLWVVLMAVGCGKKQQGLHPQRENITESVYASGVIKSLGQYQVYAPVSGLVQAVHVRAGDLVRKGQVLLTLHNTAQVLSAENASLSAELASWNRQGDRLNELRNNIELAKTRLLNDSLLFERQRQLWAQQIGSQLELEQRQLAFESARSAWQVAVLRYNDLKKSLDIAARQSEKLLAISRENAADFSIRAQTDGRVYSISREAGELVTPQSPVAVLGRADAFILEMQIDENDIARVQEGQAVLFSMDSYTGQVFEGRLSRIDPLMNERTRTFTAEAQLLKKPDRLYPNLTAEANILLRSSQNALTIPRNYLLENQYVLMKNKEKRQVKTGLKDYQKVEILEGLGPEDEIFLPGQ